MAAADKNIVITPERGSASALPRIAFTGLGNDPITLYAVDGTPGSLSFEGSAGQLLSITNSLSSGSIFSVNDISGMPSIDVNASGLIKLAPTSGTVAVGKSSVSAGSILDVNGTALFSGSIGIGTTSPIGKLTVGNSSNNFLVSVDSNASYAEIQAYNAPLYINRQGNNTIFNTGGGSVGIGTTGPLYPLHVEKSQEDLLALVNTGVVTYRFQAKTNASLAIVQNATERVRIDGTGRVGIGTTSPGAPLEVVGSANGDQLRINQSGQYYRIGREGSGGLLEFYGAQSGFNGYIFGGANGERMRINSSGNVGIGVTNPVTKLQVVGTGTFGNGVGGRLQVTTDSNLGYIDSLDNTSTNWQTLIARGTQIQFHTNTAGTTPTEKFRIDSSGNVGIGVTPSAWVANSRALQILSATSLSQTANGYTNLSSNSYESALDVYKYITSAFSTLYQQSVGQHRWYTAPSGTAGGTISWTQAMALDASSNLTVSGTVSATRLISTVATGTAPLTVTSTTVVPNLNVSYLSGFANSDFEGRYTYTLDLSNTGTYATTNYYPVTIPIGPDTSHRFKLEVALNSGTVPSWSTHASGFSITLDWEVRGLGWGTVPTVGRKINEYNEYNVNQVICGGLTQYTNDGTEVIWLRGGGRYYLRANRSVIPTVRSTSYTLPNGGTAAVTPTAINNVWSSVTRTSGYQTLYTDYIFTSITSGSVGAAYLTGNQLNAGWNTNTADQLSINYNGYQGSTTQYRDTVIYDGKNNLVARFSGSTGNVGIGAASTGSKLSVGAGNTGATAIGTFNTANANVAALALSNWTGSTSTYGPRIGFDNSGRGGFTIGGSDGSHNFDICRTWGTPDLRIDAAGRLLVGTSGARTGVATFVSGTNNTNADYQGSAGSFVGPGLVGTATNAATISVEDNREMTAGVGGSIGFGGRYLSANTSYAQWAAIAGEKSTGTSGEYGGYLAFYTRTHASASIDERMRIDSAGLVIIGPGTQNYFNGNQINAQYGNNGNAELAFNYVGYAGGTTQFRDTTIYNGKNGLVARFTGSTNVFSTVGQITSTQANSATTGAGQIYLNGATGNRIDFNTEGTAAPAFVGATGSTRSVGTKIVLYPGAGASQADAGFGIDSATLWSSVWSTAQQFKWYAGTTNIATLSGAGVLSLATDGSTLYGPNTTWSRYLRVGGNGNADTTNASVVTTNGNLHLDAAAGASATFINYYKGTGGVNFGNGASGTIGSISSAGVLSVNSTITGTQLISNIATGTAPLSVTSTTVVPNLNVTFLSGNTEVQIAENLRANRNISGGGTITVDASYNVLWSARFIVIANGSGSNFASAGYFDITCPTSGTITGDGGAANVTATAAGIPLNPWQAIYYILPIGSGNASLPANFRVVAHTSSINIPSTWVLVCIRNGDNGAVYFNNGIVLTASESMNAIQQDNANTVNTLVRRDASGNFSAGTITAALSGNATTATTATNVSGGSVAAATGAFSTYLMTLGQVRATGWYATPTGSSYTGLAVEMGMSAGSGYVVCYDRDTSVYGTLNIQGSGGSTIISLPATGSTISVTGSISSTGVVSGTQLSSSVATGTAPLTVTSTTQVTNLNSSYLQGLVPQTSGSAITANQIARADSNGYMFFSYINSGTGNSENPTVSQVIVTNGTDNYYRKSSISSFTSAVQTNASGSWGISVTGSSASCTGNAATTTILQTARSIGGTSFNGSADITPFRANTIPTIDETGVVKASATTYVARGASSTPQQYTYGVNWEFKNAAAVSGTGTYAGLLTLAPWLGTTASTGDPNYQLAFSPAAANSTAIPTLKIRAGIDATWGSWATLLNSSNYNTYAPTLTGTGASGSWGISVTGSSASCTGNAATATTATTATNVSGGSVNATTGTFSGNMSFNSGYGSAAVAYGCRAWVNFDGTGTGTFAGGASTVTRIAGSTTATITCTTAHGLSTGNVVSVNPPLTIAGAYTVTVTSTTQFTIVTAATTAISPISITFSLALIRASGNVSSITDNGVGQYTVNLTTAMPDTNYVTFIGAFVQTNGNANQGAGSIRGTSTKSTTAVGFGIVNFNDTTFADYQEVNVAIFR